MILKNRNTITGLIIGIVMMLLLFWAVKKCSSPDEPSVRNDYYILKNQITRMNKMVVVEQDFSTLQKTKLAYEIFGKQVSENEILTLTQTNAQVTYDLNKMVLEVDSVNRKLIIQELPSPEIRITPSVEIQSMDDSFLNRIKEDQIKKVTASAKADAQKRVNRAQLQQQGREQLMQNLNTIFVLAKALDYTIEDNTKMIDVSKL
ncbi:DUF4230 domain-containing protein [Chryseobacterium lacus]|uniref:DUF4230 domain-containing protein n=1 Tax=Chryseobacterium lacus TaxID=2058346 RepID=UPI0026A67C72|nr:DUF4230 domain-containing protein [Chryseobacterium lacus]